MRQRLAAQLGIPNALDHLREIVGILRARDALNVFASRLPPQIKNLADDHLDNVRALLDSPIGGHPDVFVYALILVMSRLASPWQLVRLAVKAAESDVAAKIMGSPYAVVVTIILGELDRILSRLRDDIKRGRFDAASESLRISMTRPACCARSSISPEIHRGRASSRRSAARSPTWFAPRSRPFRAACGACCASASRARCVPVRCSIAPRSRRPRP